MENKSLSLMNLKRMLSSKNGVKIVFLVILAFVCFIALYIMQTGNVITTSKQAANEGVVTDDFAGILSSMDGVGETKVYITYTDENNYAVQGIIIVAQGAKDLDVVLKMQKAAATAYNIDVDQIEVFQMKGDITYEDNGIK